MKAKKAENIKRSEPDKVNEYMQQCRHLLVKVIEALRKIILSTDKAIGEGDYADGRRLTMFYDVKDVKSKEKQLQKIIKKWLSLLEK